MELFNSIGLSTKSDNSDPDNDIDDLIFVKSSTTTNIALNSLRRYASLCREAYVPPEAPPVERPQEEIMEINLTVETEAKA